RVHASCQNRLNSIEHVVGNQRIEVSALADDTVARDVHDADVELVLQHGGERLRTDRQALPALQPSTGHFVQQLLLRESSSGEVAEDLLNNWSSLRVRYETLAVRPWDVDVADGGEERPSSQLKSGLHPRPGGI